MFDLDTDGFPAEAFDLMTSSMVTHHLDHPEVFFSKAYDGLKYGGKLCVADLVDVGMPFHEDTAEDVKREGFEIEWVKEALLNSGFAAVEIYTVVVLERERDGRNVEFPIFLAVAEK